MITPLRRRHRWLAPVAFLGALLGLGAGLAARPTELVERARQARAAGRLPEGARVIAARPHYTVALTAAGRLRLMPELALDAPDLLVYSASAAAGEAEQLPSDARLLGPASPTTATEFAWDGRDATLILYSLGHRRRFDTVLLRGLEGGR